MLVGTGVQGEPNEVESQATFSARLICKQAMFFFFFFFKPTSDNAIMLLPHNLLCILASPFSLPLSRPLHPKLWIVFPLILAVELDDPSNPVRRWGRLAARSEMVIQQQSFLCLLCLPRESQGGNFWRRHIFKYKRLCVACREPPEHVSHRPVQTRSHQQRCRPSSARAFSCTCKL